MDHLFRHHYGKMVSVLTRIFGLSNLELIEDAVQDTFIKALSAWRMNPPENPEAWLTKAAKNRVIDLFRKLQADQKRIPKLTSGPATHVINELFLDNEIEDSQLRMIFTACHPVLNPKDQIAFALKTISGFSTKEIASALLLKEETIKKRLMRARKSIAEKELSFEIPQGAELPKRLNRVLETLYLTFNEGFHSNRKDLLIRKELCGEAMRLCQLMRNNEYTRSHTVHALFALMCFHTARLDSKVGENQEIIDLKNQDRSKWYAPLIIMGNTAMNEAVTEEHYTSYHYEAAIASEHLISKSFEETNWDKILMWYERLIEIQPATITALNIAVVHIQRKDFAKADKLLVEMDPLDLEQRAYLYYGAWAELYTQQKVYDKAIKSLNEAIRLVNNDAEKSYLLKKKRTLEAMNV
ncbi:MAG: sigma-70 family RNA polymerase sigma factor [Bacteroidota bacterium]